ncbi:MAG: diguanylate cyclase [Candidatus Acidiferrales bacterium]
MMDILIADDDPVSCRLLQVSLGHAGYRVATTIDGEEALRALERPNCPRLVVLDWMMPGMDGIDVCREVRSQAREPYIYIILLTAKGQQEEIIEGLEAGADDYITKPFDLQELKARLRAGKRILELQEELVAAREQLRVQATHDSLTGLLNRTAVNEIIDREIARTIREGTEFSVIMADIDNFKSINDTYGHAIGDAVLREMARRLQASIRPYDSIGRYGGEEFLVVSPGCGLTSAAEQAERIRKCIYEEPIQAAGVTIPATMSLGFAVAPIEATLAIDLVRVADAALYCAKNNGRNRVEGNTQLSIKNH